MTSNRRRTALLVVDAFAAASARAAGIAVMAGLIKFPESRFAGSSWTCLISDHFAAGAILAIVAGGTAGTPPPGWRSSRRASEPPRVHAADWRDTGRS